MVHTVRGSLSCLRSNGGKWAVMFTVDQDARKSRFSFYSSFCFFFVLYLFFVFFLVFYLNFNLCFPLFFISKTLPNFKKWFDLLKNWNFKSNLEILKIFVVSKFYSEFQICSDIPKMFLFSKFVHKFRKGLGILEYVHASKNV